MSDRPDLPDRGGDEAGRAARRARQAGRKYEPAFKGVVKRKRSGPKVTWQERKAKQAEIDAARSADRSHWRARLEVQTRHRGKDALATLLLLIAGIGTLLAILSQQNTSLPAWVPIYGQDVIHIEGELDNAQGVTPGQGQAVMMSGIQVGLIDSVRVEDGVAVVGLNIERKYAPVVREDASILLRPRTNLNDMTIQVDPGSPQRPPIEDDARIPLANGASTVQPDQLFNALDGDTRAYLKLLLQAAAEGLDHQGKKLSAGFRRFEPFTRFIAQFNGALAKRREEMANVVHNFRRLTEELGQNQRQIEDFVASSAGALEGFANRQADIREALRELPPTLTTTRQALDHANRYANSAKTTLADLVPQAKALGPGLEASRELFEQTLDPLRDQIRPFARQVRPVLADAASAATPLKRTVTNFGDSLNSLNYGFNALAYDPGSKPGYLFYLPWLNHDINSNYVQDGGGAYRRGALLLTCRAADIADGFVLERPSLRTIQQATNAPTGDEICPPGS
jgi:phospholipid/cholesterol/gamma-HCH transport system substrate-binding protein